MQPEDPYSIEITYIKQQGEKMMILDHHTYSSKIHTRKNLHSPPFQHTFFAGPLKKKKFLAILAGGSDFLQIIYI